VSRVAIVIPWFGEELKGGAEQHAYQLAVRLGRLGHHVDVLTTCNRAFLGDWSINDFIPGVYPGEFFTVHRFAVDARDLYAFDRANGEMLGVPVADLRPGISPVGADDAATFFRENINSASLVAYIEAESRAFDAVIFLPYLYGIIQQGIAACAAGKAFLQPCLHNEVYAYLPQIAAAVHSVAGLLFLSEGERDLAVRIYGPGIMPKCFVPGAGVEFEELLGSGTHEKLPRNLARTPYVLCLGRRDPTKNTEMLISAYRAFRRQHPALELDLVLAGPGTTSYDSPSEGIHDFGLVNEQLKSALLRGCLVLAQPSQNESFSRVIMEAWALGRPVAAHRLCAATAGVVQSSAGGFIAGSEAEWAQLFEMVLSTPALAHKQMGQNGAAYVADNVSWDSVIARYSSIVMSASDTVSAVAPRGRKIHQMLPNLDCGDAISNQALVIRSYLRRCGYQSEIIIRYVDPRLSHEVQIFPHFPLDPDAAIIYHHSIGSELTETAAMHPGPSCLVYHNITPHTFFADYDAIGAQRLAEGRAQLAETASHFDFAVGDSAYNALELEDVGIRDAGVLPIVVDPDRWQIHPDRVVLQTLADKRTNLLFVGRIAPNKAQHDLVVAFAAYQTMDRDSRLILAGRYDPDSQYYHMVRRLVEELGLEESVIFTGQITDEQLMAYYMSASLFWSMSEHEGFCVPLIEAMWFDIPVLAYKCSAIPETLGSTGVMFTSKDNLVDVAGLARVLVRDEDLRRRIVVGQRKRRNVFRHQSVEKALEHLVQRLEHVPVSA
jgi:glycosyltransferase involved in cell wall biosynthesis